MSKSQSLNQIYENCYTKKGASTTVGVKNLLSRDSDRRPLDNQSDALTPPPRSALLVRLYFLCYSKNEHHMIIFTYFPRMRIIQTPRKGTLFMVFRFNMTITFLHIFRELE